jgi:hypothetical protein
MIARQKFIYCTAASIVALVGDFLFANVLTKKWRGEVLGRSARFPMNKESSYLPFRSYESPSRHQERILLLQSHAFLQPVD